MRAALACCAALLCGCVIDGVDLSDKRCECDDGYYCDRATDRCIPGTPPDAGTACGQGEEGAITVRDLRAAWATPNSIRWTWTAEGEASDFFAYELVIGASEADVRALRDVVLLTGVENPELARFQLPRGVMDEEPVTGTTMIVPDEGRGRAYFAQLVAIDTASRRSCSNIANELTEDPPTDEAVLYTDDEAGVETLPACLAPTTSAPIAGTHALEIQLYCGSAEIGAFCSAQPDPRDLCWENLSRYNVSALLDTLSAGEFASAYLEMAISYTGENPGWWSELGVWIGGAAYTYGGVTLPSDGEWRRVQVPLSQLALEPEGTERLTHAELDDPVTHFVVGSTWRNESVIRIDEVRIRW